MSRGSFRACPPGCCRGARWRCQCCWFMMGTGLPTAEPSLLADRLDTLFPSHPIALGPQPGLALAVALATEGVRGEFVWNLRRGAVSHFQHAKFHVLIYSTPLLLQPAGSPLCLRGGFYTALCKAFGGPDAAQQENCASEK